ncbi:hypothetical protein MASR1M45_15430 [Candidatus Kapaibacterium sp.]
MKINSIIIVSMIFYVILQGCMPKDSPVKPFDRGDAIISQIDMEGDSKWQVFFNLNDNKEIKRSMMTDWDLAFNCDADNNTILLNSATFMSVMNMGQVAFEDVTSSKGFVPQNEHVDGYLIIDSSALGIWYNIENDKVISKNDVFIVNRGVSFNSRPLGYRKLMILGADKEGFDIRVADLNGNNDRNIRINKKEGINYIALSLVNDEIKEIEPPSNDWDIVFTKYTYTYYVPEYTPYIVTGVLLNPKFTHVAVDSVNKYEEITLDMVENYNYTNKTDIIGFDWKNYIFDSGQYVTYPWKNYIIRDRNGFYYKLHFLDYYNNDGERGAPKFEFQKL